MLRPPRVRFIGDTYRLLFEKNPLPMWVYDVKSLYFLAVNDAAVAHSGYSRNEFLRMTIRDIQPAEDGPALLRGLDGVGSTTQTFGIWRHLTRSGGVIDVEVLSNEIDFEGHRARLVLAHDITERQRVERRLRAGFAVTRVLMGSATFREATPKLLRAVCEEADWEYGELWLASPDGGSLQWSGAWHLGGLPSAEFEDASRTIRIARGAGIPGRTWATGRPEWLSELTTDVGFERAHVAARIGLRQGMSFPIAGRDGKVLGVMAFFSRTVREPDEPFLELMTDLGERAGMFLEAQRTEEERRRAEERFANAFRGGGEG